MSAAYQTMSHKELDRSEATLSRSGERTDVMWAAACSRFRSSVETGSPR